MNRRAQRILTEDMKRVVREQRLGFVATVCPDRTPNLSPKGTTTVWDDEHLVFADIRSPGTVENLRSNPVAEINVVDPVLRKGYRFKGSTEVLAEGPRFDEIVRFYEDGPDGSDSAVTDAGDASEHRAGSAGAGVAADLPGLRPGTDRRRRSSPVGGLLGSAQPSEGRGVGTGPLTADPFDTSIK